MSSLNQLTFLALCTMLFAPTAVFTADGAPARIDEDVLHRHNAAEDIAAQSDPDSPRVPGPAPRLEDYAAPATATQAPPIGSYAAAARRGASATPHTATTTLRSAPCVAVAAGGTTADAAEADAVRATDATAGTLTTRQARIITWYDVQAFLQQADPGARPTLALPKSALWELAQIAKAHGITFQPVYNPKKKLWTIYLPSIIDQDPRFMSEEAHETMNDALTYLRDTRGIESEFLPRVITEVAKDDTTRGVIVSAPLLLAPVATAGDSPAHSVDSRAGSPSVRRAPLAGPTHVGAAATAVASADEVIARTLSVAPHALAAPAAPIISVPAATADGAGSRVACGSRDSAEASAHDGDKAPNLSHSHTSHSGAPNASIGVPSEQAASREGSVVGGHLPPPVPLLPPPAPIAPAGLAARLPVPAGATTANTAIHLAAALGASVPPPAAKVADFVQTIPPFPPRPSATEVGAKTPGEAASTPNTTDPNRNVKIAAGVLVPTTALVVVATAIGASAKPFIKWFKKHRALKKTRLDRRKPQAATNNPA